MACSPLGFLFELFEENRSRKAMILNGEAFTYKDLLGSIDQWRVRIKREGISRGSVVLLKGDYTTNTVGCLLALLDLRIIVIPVAAASVEKWQEFALVGESEFIIDLLGSGEITRTQVSAKHAYYLHLRELEAPGIVLFSSGTTGVSKGVVHNADKLLQKFHYRRKDFCTLAFLLFDHIGGLDTLFYCLSNASTLVFTDARDPETICYLIATHRIEVLPTAPSFLNLLLISGAYKSHDHSSLKIITYGAEIMPQNTLDLCVDIFPDVMFVQKFGASEIGALRSSSRGNRSKWVKISGDGYCWRVANGKLEVKSESAMIGYLNAPSPFTDDGYFKTGDCVEVEGEYIRFIGRESQVINVGGQKVFPSEVENVIKELDNLLEIAVFARPNAILGSIVCCKVRPLNYDESASSIRTSIKAHLMGRLESYKIPQQIIISHEPLTTERFKQIRS